jgi:hypothetical protein
MECDWEKGCEGGRDQRSMAAGPVGSSWAARGKGMPDKSVQEERRSLRRVRCGSRREGGSSDANEGCCSLRPHRLKASVLGVRVSR